MGRVVAYLNSVGSPTFNIRAAIYTHTANPGVIVGSASATVNASTIGTSEERVSFEFPALDTHLTSGSTYWLVLWADANDSVNYCRWHIANGVVERMVYSPNGTAWSTSSLFYTYKYCIYSTTISSSSSSSSSSSHSSSSSSSSSVSSSSSSSSGLNTVRFGDSTAATMDYPGTQDTTIFSGGSIGNAGASQTMVLGTFTPSTWYRGLIAFDLKSFHDDHPYANINAVRLKMVCFSKVRS